MKTKTIDQFRIPGSLLVVFLGSTGLGGPGTSSVVHTLNHRPTGRPRPSRGAPQVRSLVGTTSIGVRRLWLQGAESPSSDPVSVLSALKGVNEREGGGGERLQDPNGNRGERESERAAVRETAETYVRPRTWDSLGLVGAERG